MNDAVLILDTANLSYFTGVQEASGALLITKKQDYFFTRDADFIEDSIKSNDIFEDLKEIIKKEKIKELKTPFDKMSLPMYKKVSKLAKLSDYSDEVSKIRMKKSKEEIRKIKKACKLADEAMAEAKKKIKVGMTERQVRTHILKTLEKTDTVSFKPIVQSGNNSIMTHSYPTNKKIKKGEMILIDLGFNYEGYMSDMTRTFAIKPTTNQKILWGTIETAYEISMKKIKKGATYASLYNAVLDYFKEIKLEQYWKYSLGHGVGAEIHEPPTINPESKVKINNNHVFAIEPGLHIPEIGGCRLENTILFDKKPIELTKYPMEFEL